MKKEQFYIGQRVKQKDPDEGYWAYGHIQEIKEKSVIIKWGDLYEPVEHFEDEFDSIKDGNPPSFN